MLKAPLRKPQLRPTIFTHHHSIKFPSRSFIQPKIHPKSNSMSSGADSPNKITDYSRFLNSISLRREPSPIRALGPLSRLPGMISLGAGNPNPEVFPIDSLSISLKDGTKIEMGKQLLNEGLQYSPTVRCHSENVVVVIIVTITIIFFFFFESTPPPSFNFSQGFRILSSGSRKCKRGPTAPCWRTANGTFA